jgi:aspartate carbamoyltransferase catalytic subunit
MSQQFRDRDVLYDLFKTADRLQCLAKDGRLSDSSTRQLLSGGVMYEIFYEPSTRTRFSFWAAANMLGMQVCSSESAGQFSSAVKGETLEHTIRILAGQNVQVIVLRHHDTGAAQRAAAVVDKYYPNKVSIINAGDGRGQHPTQALLDVYTIWKRFGHFKLKVVVGGDLKNGRTCRSLAYLLSKFDGAQFVFVSPPELRMEDDILKHLDESGISWSIEDDLRQALAAADVVYWTRVQKERLLHPDRFEELRDRYHIGLKEMELLQPKAILMHPMPIAGEIGPEVDDHPSAIYFEQAVNGQFIRAALLLHIFGVSA